MRKLRDHNPRLRKRYFDLIAEGSAGLSRLPSGDLKYIRRTRNKRTESQRSHIGHQVNDFTGAVQKQNVDWKTHADRMNCFFAFEQQAFTGFQRRVPQQSFKARPPSIGNDAARDNGNVAGFIYRAQNFI